ncbi:protein GL2-INTERACTING REPRESSOR 2-like [Lycium ferocissimum]|uniref:protein GL2-INTERACTING REPRESSOR 2-like n=1 Tax=Lycium ferocissimum TaxID=112874 RepID=UPI002814B9CD|nr:protein GL2-INTERACTING REPRESSOR 2-like [Lycium ferocissimum]
MSRRNGNGGSKLDLKLNLSPPRVNHVPQVESPTRSLTASPISSCVSSDDSSTITSMVLVGCPRCLMYVMLAEVNDPRCPKCKSTCLLDVNGERISV